MDINGTEYKYRIQPRFGKVHAEIFYMYKPYDEEYEVHLIDKEFKKLFRSICDEDYKEAKEWCEVHLRNIFINKQ